MDVLVPHLFSVHCNTSLPFPLKNSVLRRLLLFSLCGDTMGRSASARKVCGASQPAFQKVKSVDDILAVEAIAPAGSSGDRDHMYHEGRGYPLGT